MGPFTLAWLTGEAIIIWRSVSKQGGPPWPGQLLWGSGAFLALALVAEAGAGARTLATTAAWALNGAALLNLPWKVPPNPAAAGWWAHLTSVKVPGTMIIPSGDCTATAAPAAGSGSGSSGSPGAQKGTLTPGDPNFPGIGGCPKGQAMINGKCYQITG